MKPSPIQLNSNPLCLPPLLPPQRAPTILIHPQLPHRCLDDREPPLQRLLKARRDHNLVPQTLPQQPQTLLQLREFFDRQLSRDVGSHSQADDFAARDFREGVCARLDGGVSRGFLEVVCSEAADALDGERSHLVGDVGEGVAGVEAEVGLRLSGGGFGEEDVDVAMGALDGAGGAGEGVEEGGQVGEHAG